VPQRAHLSHQLPFAFDKASFAFSAGLVLTGIGFVLGSIQSHLPPIQHPRFLAEPQHLYKQACQGSQVASEIADPTVLMLLIVGENPVGNVFPAVFSILLELHLPTQ